MGHKREGVSFVNIGTASLLVVFLVLSLVIFAALSLTSANRDYAFSLRQAESKADYYTANNAAEQMLARVDECLAAGESPESLGVKVDGDSISWETPIDERQVLSVVLETSAEAEKNYIVRSWQVEVVAERVQDESLNLLPVGGK